ncbi:adenylate/guanylate cyclase domain-containing protein [Anaeromyxobacter terrae]|uniref:adenylate/guanylate cyclase domain-containing protein n=1 Tax=Anaeromyxobacter terrae TaxID=2925406 RepID=UPI001F590316|nr:adenylate/guanylate cyclase domain-containing protein [Anaeromyxobacter sp. SG22]
MNLPRTCAVLFVDVTGSTRLYEELGDEQAHARIAQRLGRIELAAGVYGGRIVKRLGDGLMCAFAEADAAVRAAHAMQATGLKQIRGSAIGIHVGCHYGPVLERAGDLYGDCVNVAARIAGLAKTGQVVVTREVVDRLGETLRQSVRRLGHATVKGRHEPVELLEYVWEAGRADELTLIRQSVPGERVTRLRILSAGRERWLDGAGPFTLGRDAASDFVVGDREASRRHAHVERRRDAFVLVDHSANGTYVAMADETERCLRREELVLRARGRIALGRPTTDANATVLEFQCE